MEPRLGQWPGDEHRSIAETLDEALPAALVYGMSPSQFWEGDPWLFAAYREANRLRRDQAEYERWETGLYVYDALCRVAPLYDVFSKRRKANPWVEEPYGITAARSPREREEEEKRRAHEKMMAWVLRHKPSK